MLNFPYEQHDYEGDFNHGLLTDELAALPGLDAAPDEHGNVQARVTADVLRDDQGNPIGGARVYAVEGADWKQIGKVVKAHDPSGLSRWEREGRDEALAAVRAERDRRLAASDARMSPPPDAPKGFADNSAAWRRYRQELRDYPAAFIDADEPPAWPEPPVR